MIDILIELLIFGYAGFSLFRFTKKRKKENVRHAK